MRLLNATTYTFREFRQRESRPRYAILSHRWFDEEITYATLNFSELQDSDSRSPQIDKIRNTCRVAREEKLEWVWIDSCCINKDSSEELNRSINSMFKWYQEAEICYAYLSDVVSLGQEMATFKRSGSEKDSEWFERGWTLQELLAPREVKFFDMKWVFLGKRADLATKIESVTGIEARFLDGSEAFRTASIATRLSWQATRKTTEEEDMAYSLLGILGVSLVPTYGEGKQSFMKLQQELLKSYRDESIFAWTIMGQGLPRHDRPWAQDQWGLLAPWIDCFKNSRDVFTGEMLERPAGGIERIAGGVKFPMPIGEFNYEPWYALLSSLLPPLVGAYIWWGVKAYRHKHQQEWSLSLNCRKKDRSGEFKWIQVFLCRDSHGDEFWRRCRCGDLGLTNRRPPTWNRWPRTKDITIIQPTGVWWSVETEPSASRH
ncbi:hypothetical protein EG329_005623 [Mollisiaceae sp. DMI_Dod_QoI]|nr:hypothetical protein EG329_005623 [Helotiales sp. DMI_Dod_QoI]